MLNRSGLEPLTRGPVSPVCKLKLNVVISLGPLFHMTLVTGVVSERSFAQLFMAAHALAVESVGGRRDKEINRFGMAITTGLWLRGLGRDSFAGVAVDAPLDAFFIIVIMTICTFRVVGLFETQHVHSVFLFMAIGTRLRFRFDVSVVMTGLTVVFRILRHMFFVGEFVYGRLLVVTGYAQLFVHVVLVVCNEYFVELLDVTS